MPADDDSGVDAGREAAKADVTVDATESDIGCNDASQATRWDGWSRLTEVDPCCTVEVPDNVDASIAPLTWVNCLTDAGGCQEVVTAGQSGQSQFTFAVVVPTSQPASVVIGRRNDAMTGEEDVYSFISGAPAAAWRQYTSTSTAWSVYAAAAASTTWVHLIGSRDISVPPTYWLGHAATLGALHPKFDIIPNAAVAGNALQDFSASDTTLAFDVEPVGHIGRTSSTTPGQFAFTSVGNLVNPLVRGDDVLAKSYYDNSGWAEEYVVSTSGVATVLRAKPNTEVDNFATDGTSLFWTEGFGGSPGDWAQPTIQMWGATFSADLTTLGATAKQIADVSGAFAVGGIAFDGYYAVKSDRDKAWVVRASDGAKQLVAAGPNRWYGALVYVSATELWAVMSSTANVPGVAFQRQTLSSSWQ